MFDPEIRHCPTIIYRPIRPSDLQALEQLHASLFPIRYDREFFLNVVNGKGIVSWGAVDISRPDGLVDELIGFVTTRIIAVKESEIGDLIRYDISRQDQTLVYILTLGVVEQYRNLGTVYLHVIAYNQPAIHFYQKIQFRLIRRLPNFYYINGQHYDSFLFVYYLNGGRSPCSPIDVIAASAAYFMGHLRMLVAKLWKCAGSRNSRWSRCKENNGIGLAQKKRIPNTEDDICQNV